MIARLYIFRFEIFLLTQLAILFGSLVVPSAFYDFVVLPILFLISILAGILIISKKKSIAWFFVLLFLISAFIFSSSLLSNQLSQTNELIRLTTYFVFYAVVVWNIVQQVWRAKLVTRKVVFGLVSGYIGLGFLAFFMFLSIVLTNPGAFAGHLVDGQDFTVIAEALLYYAFITLLTIGYGDIVPVAPIAQKAAMLTGLVGQFYVVVITAVVVEKYIKHSSETNHKNLDV